MKESDLFLPLKKHFNEKGYKVYPEVPIHYRGVDLVAVKGDVHIAVEMKLHFNRDVVHQALFNTSDFHYSYVATPVRPKEESKYYEWCLNYGIGIYQVCKFGTICEWLEANKHDPKRVFDFSLLEEHENDLGGLPCQKGVSVAKLDILRIKHYVKHHPQANWGEIFENVQHHYANKYSLKYTLSRWHSFDLDSYKAEIQESK